MYFMLGFRAETNYRLKIPPCQQREARHGNALKGQEMPRILLLACNEPQTMLLHALIPLSP